MGAQPDGGRGPILTEVPTRPVRRDASGADDRDPVVYRGRVPAASTGPRAWLGVAATIAVIAVLVVKPWDLARPPDPASAPAAVAPVPGAIAPTVVRQEPAPDRVELPGAPAAGVCLDAGAWLVSSVERDRGLVVRIWRAMPTATVVSGPTDARIPEVLVRSDQLLELGWCAPYRGPDRPVPPAAMHAWRLEDGTATALDLVPTGAGAASLLGARYPSAGGTAANWRSGTYVFGHRSGDGREHWFRVRIETRGGAAAP